MIDFRTHGLSAARGFNSLKEHPAVLKVFADEVETTMKQLMFATDTDMIRRLQERAKAFQDILDAVETAREMLTRNPSRP